MQKNYIIQYLFLLGTIFLAMNTYSQCTTCQYPGWEHHKLFTINNTNELKDYQVKIELNTAELISNGEMNIDGSDIRVTLDCNTTILDFWFDDINTKSTKLWIKFPSLKENSVSEVFVHYGNKTATLEANPSKVFDLYDDFESGNLNKWSFDNSGNTKWELDSINGENVLACKNPPSGNGSWAILDTDLGVDDYIVELEFYAIADGNMGGIIFEHDDKDNYLGYHLMTGTDNTMITDINNGSANYSLSEPFISSPKTWYDWSIVRKSSDKKIDIYVDNQLQRTLDTKYSNGIGIWSYGGGIIYYDNLFVRKYTKIEPIVTECSPITSLSNQNQQNLAVIKAYNLQGIEISVDTKNELIILLYENGKTEKVIQY